MIFACSLTEADLVRGCAPEQPDTVKVGQEWMDVQTGSVLPVKGLRDQWIDLGGVSYTRILDEVTLRCEFVCIDPPDNVTEIKP